MKHGLKKDIEAAEACYAVIVERPPRARFNPSGGPTNTVARKTLTKATHLMKAAMALLDELPDLEDAVKPEPKKKKAKKKAKK
jgi:hypothetical protein